MKTDFSNRSGICNVQLADEIMLISIISLIFIFAHAPVLSNLTYTKHAQWLYLENAHLSVIQSCNGQSWCKTPKPWWCKTPKHPSPLCDIVRQNKQQTKQNKKQNKNTQVRNRSGGCTTGFQARSRGGRWSWIFSPEETMSREVELGCESWTSFASGCSSTAVQRTLSLWLPKHGSWNSSCAVH